MLNGDILTRTAWAFGLSIGGLGLYSLYNWILARRTSHNLLTDLGPIRPGAFILVYFTAPTCAPCKTIQRPAIEKLGKLLGSALQVIEIDASQRPEIASRWGVLSVPTTFVIDPHGKVRNINHGVARAEKLLMQIHQVRRASV